MSYTEKDFKQFVKLRDQWTLPGFGNYRRNLGRLDLSTFLQKFNQTDQDAMFKRDDKE